MSVAVNTAMSTFGGFCKVLGFPKPSDCDENITSKRCAFIDEIQFLEMCTGRLPINTAKQMYWSLSVFYGWRDGHNYHLSNSGSNEKPMWTEEIQDLSDDHLNIQLPRFLAEVRKPDGSRYARATLINMVAMLQKFIRESNGRPVDFRRDPKYFKVMQALDMAVRQSPASATKKSATPIEEMLERKMFDLVLSEDFESITDPNQFFRALVIQNGKNLALRGASEHKNLKMSCFYFGQDRFGNFVRVTLQPGKNTTPSLRNPNPQEKVVVVYEIRNGRNYYGLLRKYLACIPAQRLSDDFYLRPLAKKNEKTGIMFSSQVVGIHWIEKVVRECVEIVGGPEDHHTNHDLRATAATQLLKSGLPESEIKRFTGHSSDSVRKYLGATSEMAFKRSAILAGQPDMAPPQPKEEKPEKVAKTEVQTTCDYSGIRTLNIVINLGSQKQ